MAAGWWPTREARPSASSAPARTRCGSTPPTRAGASAPRRRWSPSRLELASADEEQHGQARGGERARAGRIAAPRPVGPADVVVARVPPVGAAEEAVVD